MKSFEKLMQLPTSEIFAFAIFAYLIKVKNVVKLFGISSNQLDESFDVSVRICISQKTGRITKDLSESLHSFIFTVNIETIHQLVIARSANNTEISNEEMRKMGHRLIFAFMMEQCWEQSTLSPVCVTEEVKEKIVISSISCLKNCPHHPWFLFTNRFMPLIAKLNRTAPH